MKKSILKKAQDASLLINRLDANKKYSAHDLNSWIFKQFVLPNNAIVLELCCGNGNQTALFSEKCDGGFIYALDCSQDALRDLENKKLVNVYPIMIDIDSLPRLPLRNKYFDIVFCSYGLYYSRKPKLLVDKIYTLLKPGAQFIVIGPSGSNNKELYRFLESMYSLDDEVIKSSSTFMPDILLYCRSLFRKVKKSYFLNHVSYPDEKSLFRYVSSSTFFDPQYEYHIKKKINTFYQKGRKFVLTKKAMCIVAEK